MPAASPAGPISEITEAFRTVVANCTTFQTWTSTANATAALDRVHLYFADGSATRPLAWIDDGDSFASDREGIGVDSYSGNIVLAFEMDHDDSISDADGKRRFNNAIGQICAEIKNKRFSSPSISSPAFSRWDRFQRPILVEGATEDSAGTPAQPDVYWFAMVMFTFGPGA